MARLIDADSILDDFLKRYTERERDRQLVFAACEIKQDFADMISNATTVDAVEVVRCKDCIRRYDTDECPMCFLIEGKYYEYTNGNGFCYRGERKEGAE